MVHAGIPTVIPAKAGISPPRAGWRALAWEIPAFAGMTSKGRRLLAAGVFLVTVGAFAATATAQDSGAPYNGQRFFNEGGARPQPGFWDMASFLGRKVATSLVPRGAGAPFVAYDPQMLQHNPSATWIGHATFLVRMDGMTFLTDPMFSDRASPFGFAGPKRLVPPGVPLAALPHVDFATISHDHYDHMDLATIEALAKGGTRFVVGKGTAALVRSAGGDAIELDWWESVQIGNVRVYCVPVQHQGGRSLGDQGQRLWAGWVVEGPTRRFLHSGDTGYFNGFAKIGQRFGALDLAALPIGAYDPPSIMRFVHMNPEEAVHAAKDLHTKRVVGMHWGTFDLTDEGLDEPPKRFRAAAAEAGFADDAWILAVGETRDF
jgi:N-acyl-phosphatidylethanolamine-hydrolysing phospholipase D